MDHIEQFEAPTILEAFKSGPHLAKITGRFMAEGARSSNGRLYENTAPWIRKAQLRIDGGAAVDMRAGHASALASGQDTGSAGIIGKITRLNEDGTYEGLIVNNAQGREHLPLIQGGYIKHVSLRAKTATSEPIESGGGVRITDVDGFSGIDLTNNPGIGAASIALIESNNGDGDVILESFPLLAPTTSTGDPTVTISETLNQHTGNAPATPPVVEAVPTTETVIPETAPVTPEAAAPATIAESINAAVAPAETEPVAESDPSPERGKKNNKGQDMDAIVAAVLAKLIIAIPAPAPVETAPAPALSESLESVKSIVESAVTAAVASERARFETTLTEQNTAHEAAITEILSAKRKTVAISEAGNTEERLPLGKALAAVIAGQTRN
ncbi:MAG: hypothetical protein NVS1B6_18860 [Steroidobacteraceae bacterium]